MSSPTAQCLKRLQIELRKLAAEPDAGYQVGADPNNMLRCYFVMNGPEGTPYAGGRYVGLLEIPPDYPFKPPSVQLCTPSGRFRTGMAICLSNSSYHPEQWSPMWGLRTILIALVSFFVSNEATTGSMEGTDEDRRKYAANSRQYNVERIKTVYKRVLPDAYAKDVAYLERQRLGEEQDTATEPTGSDSDETAGDDDQRDADHAQKRTKAEASTGAVGAATSSSGTPPQKKDGAPSGGKAVDGAEDAEAARRAGEGAEGREKPSDAEGTHRRHHHRSQHQHLSEQKTDTVFRLRDVPWRRWVSVAVLVVVALTLVEQLR